MKNMIRMVVLSFLAALAGSHVACNTVKGLSTDIHNAADATQNALTTQPSK